MEVNPNSQQPTGSNVAPNGLGNVQRPGEYLRQVRVSQHRDIKAVATDLNMPLKTLEALEKDEYKSLPEATFIKGYYRSYAKYLNVDATAIIQRFDDIYQNDTGLMPNHALNNSPIKIMGKLPGSNSDRNKKWLKRALIAVIALAVIWAVVAGIQKWSSSKNDGSDAKPQQSDVEVLSMNNSSSHSSGDQMVLNFSRPTSVNIVDSTGKVLATGRQSSTLTLTGESPFQIRLDDAAAVSLSLNNEQISLSPYTVNGKAEFRLSR
ncbi:MULTISPECIES: helix-turn-helix domain-containing protein [Acinetobacter]|uniref:helix-turn-helix domain-containing protein n=1 Tax=Acinetobacter TaxID=469 RepID=UPI001020FB73|nr:MULTISPECIES: helix-turn-helix domain-containing protein [Acinetobacter]MDM1757754.1 helix-turn-helix domain-containing protein [Acinetobacter sp. 256-1]MDM1761850.1 helix-turn-helix domain-containing protein [Acinetobacter sp. 251-1]RYL25872.1 helix-turn-helix domain-containing protein [Acinetobacter piscicola]